MRTSALLIIAALVSVSLLSCVCAASATQLGVKEGDWIRYTVEIEGNPSPIHRNVTWMQLEVLEVDGDAFPANVTVGFANGTAKSSIWDFNFTAGNTGGWIIIPANLNVGDTFFDNYSKTDKNIAVQSEFEKNVLGQNRAVTYAITFGNGTHRDKLWDKQTGVFVESVEVFKNWTAHVQAVDTNMWSPQSSTEQNNITPYLALIGVDLTALAASGIVLLADKTKKIVLKPKVKNVFSGVLLISFITTVGSVAMTPLSQSVIPMNMTFRDVNMIMQSLWFSLLLLGMWFRKKGNYLMHGVLTIFVVFITLMSFVGVLVLSPPNGSEMGGYFTTAADVLVFFAHAIFSFPALAFGLWLVAIWRPNSPSFPAKSRRAAQLLTIFWTLSYIVGVLDYALIRGLIS